MARGLIDQYGPNSSQPQAAPAKCGGVRKGDPMDVDVMNYSPPTGPKNIMDPQNPGIHGKMRNNDQRPMAGSEGGTVGLGGPRTPLKGGSQGQY